MSEEFQPTPENYYSPFYPILILLIGLLIWVGYQDWATNTQRSLYNKQFQAAYPTVQQAQNISTHYASLLKDLQETAQKDATAAEIFKLAVQAGAQSGLIHVQQGTNAPASTPPAEAGK